MKKAIRIQIGGLYFNIEEEAYKILESWLQKVQDLLAGKEGAKEIADDIEAGAAEHFKNRITDENTCLTLDDVENVIAIMGYPEDFIEGEHEKHSYVSSETDDAKQPRRLYRDPDERILGGVCSGIGHYFNLDPVIVRIILVVAVLLWGSGVLAYLILWIIIPEAKTATQKLEMRGESLNISNIEKNIKYEISQVKKGYRKISGAGRGRQFSDALNEMVDVLGKVIKIALRVVVVALGAFMILFGALMFIAFLTGLFIGDLIPLDDNQAFSVRDLFEVLPMDISYFSVSTALFLALGIPFIMLAYSGIRIVFNVKRKFKIFEFSALGLWIIGVIFTAYLAIKTASHFKQRDVETKTYNLEPMGTDTVFVELEKNYDPDFDFSEAQFHLFHIKKKIDKPKIFGRPKLTVEKTNGKDIKIEMKYRTSGKTVRDAALQSKKIAYNWTQTDSMLTFDPYFIINSDSKFYNQQIDIILYLPVGKSVYLGETTDMLIYDVPNIENEWDGDMTGKTWIMTEDGLTNADNKSLPKNEPNNSNENKKLEEMNKELKSM